MNSKVFNTVQSLLCHFLDNQKQLPTLNTYNDFLQQANPAIVTAAGLPIKAVNQETYKHFQDNYEASIYRRGELRTRENNWHDFFNFLMWFVFPKTKAVINKWQYHKLSSRSLSEQRLPVENLLTQLDEGGILVFSSNKELIAMLRERQWHDLFWKNRYRLESEMQFVLIGHAMYEQMLNPMMGLTSSALIFEVDSFIMKKSQIEKLNYFDSLCAAYLDNDNWHLSVKKWLSLPILGIPGWFAENEQERFYNNSNYFWSLRRGR